MENDRIRELVDKLLKMFHIRTSNKTRNLLVQIFKFGLVGGTAFIIDFVFLYLFKEVFHLSVLVSNTLSFCISVIYNYIASVKWVFDIDKKKSAKRNFVIFIIFSILGLILNDLIMFLMVERVNIHYLISKIVATIVVMVFNFITRKKFLE